MRLLAPIVGLVLSALSVALLVVSIIEVLKGEETMAIYLLLAAIALTSVSWLISRTLRAPREKPSIRAFRVLTEITCQSCGLREVREFREGDFIFKEVGSCPRCQGKLLITSIFREKEVSPRRA
mgnify:CR=1 FL=1